jgi:hypothetical protein
VVDYQHISADGAAASNFLLLAIHLHNCPYESRTLMRTSERLDSRMSVDPRDVDSETGAEQEGDTCGLAHVSGLPEVYNEQAFRYFLAIEGKRAERSSRALLLLLADVKGDSGRRAPIGAEVAGQLFSALAMALRETDFVGWYREHHVAGAVLTQRVALESADVSQRVCDRVTKAVAERLPKHMSERLQLRVFQIPSGPKGGRS